MARKEVRKSSRSLQGSKISEKRTDRGSVSRTGWTNQNGRREDW